MKLRNFVTDQIVADDTSIADEAIDNSAYDTWFNDRLRVPESATVIFSSPSISAHWQSIEQLNETWDVFGDKLFDEPAEEWFSGGGSLGPLVPLVDKNTCSDDCPKEVHIHFEKSALNHFAPLEHFVSNINRQPNHMPRIEEKIDAVTLNRQLNCKHSLIKGACDSIKRCVHCGISEYDLEVRK